MIYCKTDSNADFTAIQDFFRRCGFHLKVIDPLDAHIHVRSPLVSIDRYNNTLPDGTIGGAFNLLALNGVQRRGKISYVDSLTGPEKCFVLGHEAIHVIDGTILGTGSHYAMDGEYDDDLPLPIRNALKELSYEFWETKRYKVWYLRKNKAAMEINAIESYLKAGPFWKLLLKWRVRKLIGHYESIKDTYLESNGYIKNSEMFADAFLQYLAHRYCNELHECCMGPNTVNDLLVDQAMRARDQYYHMAKPNDNPALSMPAIEEYQQCFSLAEILRLKPQFDIVWDWLCKQSALMSEPAPGHAVVDPQNVNEVIKEEEITLSDDELDSGDGHPETY